MKRLKNTGMKKRIYIKDESETREFGKNLAAELKAGSVVALVGDLGTGKTTLTKYIAEGLSVSEVVTSPTFTIINEYKSGRLPLYHFDAYRLSSEEEMYALGYEEYFYGDGVTVVEWADKVAGLIPVQSITINLAYGANGSERVYDVYFGV